MTRRMFAALPAALPAVKGASIFPVDPATPIEIEIVVHSASIQYADEVAARLQLIARNLVADTYREWSGSGWGLGFEINQVSPIYEIHHTMTGKYKPLPPSPDVIPVE